MAHRVAITKAGSPSVLKILEMDMPIPKEGEVCIEVHFAGINFADTLMRLGLYQPRPPFPFTPGYELSGTINSLGSGVTGFEVGQRVVAAMPTGGQSSHVTVKTSRVIPVPDEMGLDEAAAMPVTYLTAHHMLHYLGHLKKGETVLIHGGAGGVGTAALQICQWAGIDNVWATASGSKSEIIESFGGIPIDRHNQDFVQIIKEATDGRGVDHILDPIGGDNLTRSLSVLAEGGRLYTYGMSAAAPSSKRSMIRAFLAWRKTPKFDPLKLMTRNRGVFGVHMGTWKDEDAMSEQLYKIMEGIKLGHLKPVIDSVFDAEDVADAHQYIHDAKNIGKVLLRFKK
ncbi:MAG: zinc-binding dehydrogenase [Euryarchaeota archaeon]|jgi:NADPH:quinone reductase-like Zn-dependent oxidoreductase|nr:zinc-binding dehydrogenase [Euryarchaeota archaeon]